MKKHLLSLIPCLVSMISVAAAQVVYTCDFEEGQMTNWRLGPYAKVADKTLVFTFNQKNIAEPGRAILPFDFTKYAGKALLMSAEIQYENVSKPAQDWNGVKFMMIFKTKDGQTHWMHPSGMWGNADWKAINYSCNIPEDVQPGTLEFGLQDSTGTVRLRKLKLTQHDPVVVFPRLTPKDYQCIYTDRVTKEPIRRGVMSTGNFSPDVVKSHLPDLQKWGATLYRWQLIRGWGQVNDNQDCEEYLNWVRGKIDGTKQVLDKAQELGIKVVLDLHVAPGGRKPNGNMNMFEDEKYANTFIEAWKILATAVKGHPALFGYDLINEPSQPAAPVPFNYLELQYRVAKVVRAIDPDTPIIIESNGWDSPNEFTHLSPLPMKDIIYQAHMYQPMEFTHQGVGRPKGGSFFYPNPERKIDKEHLYRGLAAVREFQKRHGARIYIGEFSAIRWAKGADKYLADVISIFEEYGWDWSYHAFREWDGWSVEHSADPDDHKVSSVDTDRKKALLKGLENNRK